MTPADGPEAAPQPEGGTAFAVELPVFTGPFRVLADLILEQKVDVCDVPIASVTDARGFKASCRAHRSGTPRRSSNRITSGSCVN